MNLIEHVETAFQNAENETSKLTPEILSLLGMSGTYTRHFYNNLCSMPNARYLEIGTWAGSTLASAMYENEMTCVAIDNWSEFGGPKEEFLQILERYRGRNRVTFHEADCWSPDIIERLRSMRFNLYVYDGYHSEQAQYDALVKYLPCMDDTFVFVVDDWNTPEARRGTERALQDAGVRVLWRNQIRLTWDDSHTPMDMARRTWWNGIAVFVLAKEQCMVSPGRPPWPLP